MVDSRFVAALAAGEALSRLPVRSEDSPDRAAGVAIIIADLVEHYGKVERPERTAPAGVCLAYIQ
jgi:hypothetical protein